ncbi:MAG: biotin synthase BioB [bacterium]|nr:biotin synthase BioB [Planctomycetota bacterium]HIL50927.1 biotin synthase BioB [Planctomycetota bacterium]
MTTTQISPAPGGLTLDAVEALFGRPLLELTFEAAKVHRLHHDPREVQCSQLISIKTGGCPEDCGYCSQSAHSKTATRSEDRLSVKATLEAARNAQAAGADRFCMGAAWREVREGEDFEAVLDMVRGVKELGLETCVTLGMLKESQAQRLKDAGLDYYNHNLDTGRSYYGEVVSTHDFDDRIETLGNVRSAGIHVCSGGILGLGESMQARAELLFELASLDPQPESVPINALVPIEGTPLGSDPTVDWSEMLATIAAARILMPRAVIRLSAGRGEMSEEAQALCFLAGANSIFVGDQLLTTANPQPSSDAAMFQKLGLNPVRRG